jgi:two-component system, LytTR family, response regulator
MEAFDNPVDAIDFLGDQKVDLIFLDIQMDGFSGFQLIEAIRDRPEIIVTTAFDHYALKGFEFDVSDFLLKPYTFERFFQSVSRVHAALNVWQDKPSYIFIKTEYRLEKVFIDSILYIEGMRDYRRIQTLQKSIMTMETFRDLEKILPSREFCRVHKSWMVSIRQIQLIERDRIRIDKALIPISETYKEKFYNMISADR